MVSGMSGNARRLTAFALGAAVMVAAMPMHVWAGPDAAYAVVDEAPYDGGAGSGSEGDADQPAQRAPESDEPSEDGTDGSTGGNAAEPPSGCMFRDGPLELVV